MTNNTRKKNNSKNRNIKYPPNTINNYISHIIYINLDHRTNRDNRIKKELTVFDPAKVTRMSAVKNDEPAIGCALSHINALKMARDNNYSNVLIMEDDAVWGNVTKGFKIFENLVKNPYDVIMLGGTYPQFNKETHRVEFSYGAHAYLVNSQYYDKIILSAEKGLTQKEGYQIDAVYSQLQKTDNWYIVYPPLVIQGKSYSNIAKQHVNYSKASKLEENKGKNIRSI